MRIPGRHSTKSRHQRGDTIIEVLIAVGVVGAVLAGAFTVTQKSAVAVRNSQEQGEMLQILQSQVELVRAQALESTNTNTGVFDTSPTFFCIDEVTKLRENLGGATGTLPPLNEDNFSIYGNCTFGSSDMYHVAIRYDAATKQHTFTGRWDRLRGGKNQEQLTYRIYAGKVGTAGQNSSYATVRSSKIDPLPYFVRNRAAEVPGRSLV